MVYIDETVVQSALGGILLLVAGAWVLWAAAWLRRIELRAAAEAEAEALGLRLAREGWGPEQRALGSFQDVAVELRWRRSVGALRVRARVGGGRWREAPAEGLGAWLAQAVSG